MTLPDGFREVNITRHPKGCIGCEARASLVIIVLTRGTEREGEQRQHWVECVP